ncbi:hypothetical protein [Nocardioides sp. LHG3406-4]|uniref:hypothetical protein n=1 Tax=Nocardioides sp. LHG3406-4 TaxID=2804575 RepID=UPI003CEAF141
MREPKVYSGWERPLVEVFVDGTWCPSELRAWLPVGKDEWKANVSWSREPGSTFLDTVTADRVRPVDET